MWQRLYGCVCVCYCCFCFLFFTTSSISYDCQIHAFDFLALIEFKSRNIRERRQAAKEPHSAFISFHSYFIFTYYSAIYFNFFFFLHFLYIFILLSSCLCFSFLLLHEYLNFNLCSCTILQQQRRNLKLMLQFLIMSTILLIY